MNAHMPGAAVSHIACETERPRAGTFWGTERYKVDGYYLTRLGEHGLPVSYGERFDEYEEAAAEAKLLGYDSVSMVTLHVDCFGA